MNNFQSDINLGVSSSEKFFSGLVECVDSLIHHLGYRGKPYGPLHLKKNELQKQCVHTALGRQVQTAPHTSSTDLVLQQAESWVSSRNSGITFINKALKKNNFLLIQMRSSGLCEVERTPLAEMHVVWS